MRELTMNEMEDASGGAAWYIPVGAVLVATHMLIPYAEGYVSEMFG